MSARKDRAGHCPVPSILQRPAAYPVVGETRSRTESWTFGELRPSSFARATLTVASYWYCFEAGFAYTEDGPCFVEYANHNPIIRVELEVMAT